MHQIVLITSDTIVSILLYSDVNLPTGSGAEAATSAGVEEKRKDKKLTPRANMLLTDSFHRPNTATLMFGQWKTCLGTILYKKSK